MAKWLRFKQSFRVDDFVAYTKRVDEFVANANSMATEAEWLVLGRRAKECHALCVLWRLAVGDGSKSDNGGDAAQFLDFLVGVATSSRALHGGSSLAGCLQHAHNITVPLVIAWNRGRTTTDCVVAFCRRTARLVKDGGVGVTTRGKLDLHSNVDVFFDLLVLYRAYCYLVDETRMYLVALAAFGLVVV